MDKVKDQPTNGTLTATEARAILEQAAKTQQAETDERLKRYTDIMNKASEDYKAGIMQTVTLPGGEIVSLASWLKSINANVTPGMQVVSK